MQTTDEPLQNAPEAPAQLIAAAAEAETWAGEPFLGPEEDPAVVLAPGTSRRAALDEALAEIAAGRNRPSPRWKTRFGLMLGLERVLRDPAPKLASGTELRRHQVDALAGMLTELIAANEHAALDPGANGAADLGEEEDDESDDDLGLADADEDEADGEGDEPSFEGDDPGAVRRFRFRHPTASGKTIAAAGF